MPISQVVGQATGTQRAGSSAAAITLIYPSATTVGNLLVCVVSFDGAGDCAVADNKSNTWYKAVSKTGSGGCTSQIWYAVVVTGGTGHVVTVTPNAATYLSAVIDEFSGFSSASPLDTTDSDSGSSSTFASGSVTTLTAGELIIAAVDCDSSNSSLSSSGAGFTEVYNHAATSSQEGLGYAYQVASSGAWDRARKERRFRA